MNTRWVARIAILALSMAGFGVLAIDAHAQSYPNKPITFIVPFGPGTGNDVVARIIAQKVGENGTVQMVVDNRPGASGTIALELTAKSPPNGYTIVIASTSQILAQFVAKVRFDILKDFAPVSVAGSLPYVMAVASSSPIKSVDELVARAKARPGKLSYSGGMVGGVPHFMGVMLLSARNIDMVMVPYKSTTDAQADVFAGRVEVWFTTLASALPQVKAGKIRILGVTGGKRAAALPDVPSMQEAGVPTLDASVTFFILAAAGTPRSATSALNAEIVKAISAKDVRDRLMAAGVEPMSSTPEELERLLKSEVARWGKVIKESGYHAE